MENPKENEIPSSYTVRLRLKRPIEKCWLKENIEHLLVTSSESKVQRTRLNVIISPGH